MVTVEMAVSLIAATLVVATSCWVVGLVVVEDACRTTAARWPVRWLAGIPRRLGRPRVTRPPEPRYLQPHPAAG
ncbi:hypothetical protein JCM18918_3199 [Cutibacterium acnes JCM 18918]|nr:hypothetical protein JCM18918_3199 [Cutibacterium acnes JCM 18918]